jgi:hypothetical protein
LSPVSLEVEGEECGESRVKTSEKLLDNGDPAGICESERRMSLAGRTEATAVEMPEASIARSNSSSHSCSFRSLSCRSSSLSLLKVVNSSASGSRVGSSWK